MFYSHQDVNDFVNWVKNNYFVGEQDVRKMVTEEYIFQENIYVGRKTKNAKEDMLQAALANCRFWLSEDRKIIDPIDLVSFRVAKNYFNSIRKLEK